MKRNSQCNYGTYATAIGLATIGATVSLSGLIAMFGLAFLPIGVGLEVAKLVAARRLRQGDLTGALRATLIALIAICMAVTMVGIYGFISRCYTDRVATMTQGTDHALAEATERVKVAEQAVAGVEQQIARLDAPETKTIKVKVAGRTTETTVPVAKDKAARAPLEVRQTKAATELAELRVQLASRQAEHAHVEAEINTIRAIASAVGLGVDIGRAVHILAGILAVMWDPFALLLLLTVRRVERFKPKRVAVGKPKRKAPAKPKPATNVVRYPQPAM